MLVAEFETATARSVSPAAWRLDDLSGVSTFDQFAGLAIGRADLSRAASGIAVQEASRADVREFAEFELMEAEAIVAAIDDLGTPVPPMGGQTWVALAQIINAPAGHAFDTAYMRAEYENHVLLRNLAATYLRTSGTDITRPHERYGRQLAKVALFAFNEHVGVTRKILRRLAM